MLTETRPGSSNTGVHEKEAKLIKIHSPGNILSVAFLVDGKRIVSGDQEGKIRCWRVEDGGEVGTPVEAGGIVWDIAVSQDGEWVVSGTEEGKVRVWNAETLERAIGIKGQSKWVYAVDVSPDGTTVATGSGDYTVSVWSRSTGERLLGPLQHQNVVCNVKFSPDGHIFATATQDGIRTYGSEDGHLIRDVPIEISSPVNQSLAWASDSKQLFALSHDNHIYCVDVPTGETGSQWSVRSDKTPWLVRSDETPWSVRSDKTLMCISLASNGKFIAVSAGSLVSFWDTTTQQQIGRVVQHIASIMSMAISANYALAIGGGETITLRSLGDILSPSYTSEDGDDVLEHEMPSSAPAPEFNFDEPPSPTSNYREDETPSAGPSHPKAGHSIVKKWRQWKSKKDATSHDPGRRFGKSRQPADRQSPSPSPARVHDINEGPSRMAAAQLRQRTVAAYRKREPFLTLVRRSIVGAQDKKCNPSVPNRSSDNASHSEQHATDPSTEDTAPRQESSNPSQPPAAGVYVTEGSRHATIAIRIPMWMLCIHSAAHDETR